MVACMAVMARERWTDEQLDKAFGRVDGDLREIRVELKKGFEQIDQRFEQMERRFDKVDERFDKVDERFDKVDERFEKVDERFDRVATWLVSMCCTIIGSLVAGLIASQAFG
jgi:archaellum component FlaC